MSYPGFPKIAIFHVFIFKLKLFQINSLLTILKYVLKPLEINGDTTLVFQNLHCGQGSRASQVAIYLGKSSLLGKLKENSLDGLLSYFFIGLKFIIKNYCEDSINPKIYLKLFHKFYLQLLSFFHLLYANKTIKSPSNGLSPCFKNMLRGLTSSGRRSEWKNPDSSLPDIYLIYS